jgi:phage baseplate assembly protein W
MNVDYPYRFDARGRTAEAGDADHVRDLIEQVLFTLPGERVNRPTFGSGVMQLMFAPLSDELAATAQFLVQGALEQWLGDVLAVEQVRVSRDDSTLRVLVQYVIQRTGERRTETFERAGGAA